MGLGVEINVWLGIRTVDGSAPVVTDIGTEDAEIAVLQLLLRSSKTKTPNWKIRLLRDIL